MSQSEDENVSVPLSALERLLAKRRAEGATAGAELVLRVGETTLYEAEKQLVTRTLAALGGNRTKTCTTLGITRPTLARKLKAYEAETGGAA
jgi:DNA-binding NtrC family response regulator